MYIDMYRLYISIYKCILYAPVLLTGGGAFWLVPLYTHKEHTISDSRRIRTIGNPKHAPP